MDLQSEWDAIRQEKEQAATTVDAGNRNDGALGKVKKMFNFF
jgi:hypothetical protein